ncbi:phospho-2-dehydro-3-deoxyheptonate aldolase 1, chloroplastic, partial [Arachis duranensis]|uniref:Phospho-2-dehydro-3-deoxyheptonate aldolase n=2 Tax=Arachis TaxID=3817 RepID=A0A6P4BQD2_ARADU
MALSSVTTFSTSLSHETTQHSLSSHQPSSKIKTVVATNHHHQPRRILAVHAADAPKGAATTSAAVTTTKSGSKWNVDSWKSKKALQLPEYPDKNELETVLKTIESFPPIVFAGEARRLEERLAEAAMGKA